jgi:hypothetical protein
MGLDAIPGKDLVPCPTSVAPHRDVLIQTLVDRTSLILVTIHGI